MFRAIEIVKPEIVAKLLTTLWVLNAITDTLSEFYEGRFLKPSACVPSLYTEAVVLGAK